MAKDFPKRSENYSEWYNELVVRADLAEQSAVRGCMVIKPYGYAIWEKMHDQLDQVTSTPTSPSSSPRASSPVRPSTSRVSPKSAPSSPTIAS